MVQSGNPDSQVYDVIVLGCGVVGATLAWKLAADGFRVCVCGEDREVAESFCTGHLPQQAVDLFRDLGLFERLRPLLSALDYTANFRNGRLIQVTSDEDYAVSHRRIVNTLRQGLERLGSLFCEPVVRVSAQGRVKSIRLQSGRVLCGWMLAVAMDGAGARRAIPGLEEEVLWKDHSLSFSWNMELGDPARMDYPALIFRTSRPGHAYEHLRLFQMQDGLRGNFFTFWGAGDERRSALAAGKAKTVFSGTVEGFLDYLGDFRITSTLREAPVSLTRIHGGAEAGIALVGDACGQLAPFQELGLCKGLHDAKVLAKLAPGWLRERQVTAEVLAEYQAHPAKRAFDEGAYSKCVFLRRMAVDQSPEWLVRRWKADCVPEWLESACRRGVEGGRWTLENLGLPVWRKSLELVQNYRDRRERKAGRCSGGLATAGDGGGPGASDFDDLPS